MDLRLDFPAASGGGLHLLIAPHPALDRLADACIARLPLSGPACVLDGGNRFDIHAVARQVRRHTAAMDAALQRVSIARAFTCTQMAVLLAEQPAGGAPLLALNLLASFQDENVPEAERLRLLGGCLAALRRLSCSRPVLVTAAPARLPATAGFLARLAAAADHTWRLDLPSGAEQPRLFE